MQDPDNATPAGAAYAQPLFFAHYNSFCLLLVCFSSLIVRSGSVSTLDIKRNKTNSTTETRRRSMAEEKVQDYTKADTDGHVDTREANKECEKPDPHLGCDPGIDVAG
jgi:hypothetical protein